LALISTQVHSTVYDYETMRIKPEACHEHTTSEFTDMACEMAAKCGVSEKEEFNPETWAEIESALESVCL
jgi:hypothetical protein